MKSAVAVVAALWLWLGTAPCQAGIAKPPPEISHAMGQGNGTTTTNASQASHPDSGPLQQPHTATILTQNPADVDVVDLTENAATPPAAGPPPLRLFMLILLGLVGLAVVAYGWSRRPTDR